MSSKEFSNTSTGGKSADPYKAKNLDEPNIKEKVTDLITFIESSKFGMMTTRQDSTGLLVSRCMALAAKENGVDLLFHTNTESGKTDELASDPNINIAFLNSSGEWASVSGKAEVITDRGLVKKYYSPALKAWVGDLGDGKHDGGPDDPRIGIIRVATETATYALARHSAVTRGVELAKGVLTGDAPSVNKLRQLSNEELQTWRQSSQMVS
ncbi:MAG: BLI-3 blue-light-inducible Bli-3 protein [Vezdaea acicularis]|nr:MAG: BLI-3 blue-light-inducible Bli-3 protein [Vezdaea acicularis]